MISNFPLIDGPLIVKGSSMNDHELHPFGDDEVYPFGLEVERLAAALWRRENPDMSVFACDAKMKDEYRQRILGAREPKK